MTNRIEVVPVHSQRDRMAFIKLPWKIYKNDPYWVPPLIIDMKKMLNPKKNPFFQHAEAELFLARRNRELRGRIAAVVNHRHNEFHNERTGFFGFFECVEDYDVAEALLTTAREWVKARGMTLLRGPVNLSTNDTCGFLVEGFDSSPVIMMTYNPPYYLEFMERFGLQKAKDLYAYQLTKDSPMPERYLNLAKRTKERSGATFRTLRMKDFWNEVERVKKIYNEAWSRNWGFVPMTDAEFEHLAKDLKPAVDPHLVFFAEIDGEPVGFSLSLPDMNQALKKINGRLFPFGLLKLLWFARKVDGIRVITLGVRPQYRQRGIETIFYVETYFRGIERGYTRGEFSWILEDNLLMRKPLEMMGAKLYKKYRIYEMPV